MWWLWILTGLACLIALALLAMWLIGRTIPIGHVTAASIDLRQPPEVVWDLLDDVASYPSWSRISKVERLPDQDGHAVWRQHFGRNSVVTHITASRKPAIIEHTIADDAQYFSGLWIYELLPREGGCTLTLTERGEIHVAIPRFMMKHVVDPAQYLRGQLRSIAEKFGETPAIRVKT
jgi:Polyketide cyclase / dehydrase and lipid transport